MPDYVLIYLFSLIILLVILILFSRKLTDKILSKYIKNRWAIILISRRNISNYWSIVKIFKTIIYKTENCYLVKKTFVLYKQPVIQYTIKVCKQIINQFFSLNIILIVLYIIFTIVKTPNIPDEIYFYIFLSIPVIANTWIYFVYGKGKPRNSEDESVRRIICYIIIIILLFSDSRTKFLEFTAHGKVNTTTNVLVSGVVTVLFIGMDRILKVIIEDYDKFKKQIN